MFLTRQAFGSYTPYIYLRIFKGFRSRSTSVPAPQQRAPLRTDRSSVMTSRLPASVLPACARHTSLIHFQCIPLTSKGFGFGIRSTWRTMSRRKGGLNPTCQDKTCTLRIAFDSRHTHDVKKSKRSASGPCMTRTTMASRSNIAIWSNPESAPPTSGVPP